MNARRAVRVLGVLAVTAMAPAGSASGATDPAPTAASDPVPAQPLLAGAWPESAAVARQAQFPHVATSAPRSLSAGASFTAGTGQLGNQSTNAWRLDGSLRAQLTPAIAAELRTALHTSDQPAAFERRASRTEARLSAGDEAQGAWLGLAYEHDLSGGISDRGPLLTVGAARRAGAVGLGAAVVQTVDRVVVERQGVMDFGPKQAHVPPGGEPESLYVWRFTEAHIGIATDALLSGRWEHRRLSLETLAGVTLNPVVTPRWWSQVGASVAVAPHISLFGTAGKPAPRWLALNASPDARATLGVRLTTQASPALEPEPGRPSPPAWKLRPLGEGWYVIEIRVAHASAVSVMGDFTEWNPGALQHLSGPRWAVAVQLAPGVHQVQVRIDGGAWQAPAGLAAVDDGFSGSAGVFVAE
jgi:hypothetical protein